MIELKNDRLVFAFPEVHADARLEIGFQRTFRIPDDGKAYPLPPGFGFFPLRHVDDHATGVPPAWLEHGGVMLPMYQAEALWLYFTCPYIPDRGTGYPFAIKVATGKIDAVTGQNLTNGLQTQPQNYLVAPTQPWLDGYCVEKGYIRQFVAMPLGKGYTAEEQITGKAAHGGLQIIVHPMKREVFERRFPKRKYVESFLREFGDADMLCDLGPECEEMGLAPGGRMRQEIYEDPFGLDDWDTSARSRCFVHSAHSLLWQSITGEHAPTKPPTAKQYSQAGLPWFDYYNESATPLQGSGILHKLKSVFTMGQEKRESPLPENESAIPEMIVQLRTGLKKDQVREGAF